MVMYGITLTPLEEDLRAVDQGLLPPFYADDADFGGLVRRSAQLLKLLMKRGADRGSWEPPVTNLSREGVIQGDPLSMVLYVITLIHLVEDLRAVDPGLLSPFLRG